MRFLLIIAMLLGAAVYADVPRPVRDTPYDWRCVNPDGTFTSHQRQDTAIYACQDRAENNPGQTFYIEGGRYRVVSNAVPPPVDYGPADEEYIASVPSADSIHPNVSAGTRVRVWYLSGLVEVLPNGSTRASVAPYSLAWSEQTLTGWSQPREIIWN